MDVFSLVAKLTLDSSEYDQNLNNSGKKASTFGDKLKTAFQVGGAAIAAVTTATAGMTVAFIKGASDVAVYGDGIDKMSQKMGMSAAAYQEWDAVMQHSGTSIESLQAGMKTLANAVENGNGAFERLGITQENIASMNNEELFSATITALQNVENETERTYLAGQLLGRGATELGALLNTSAEDTQAMKNRVHELGGVMSDEAVKVSARFQDSLQDMQTTLSGLKRGMVGDFLPAISDVMDGLTELFSGGDGMKQITQGISGIVSGISAAIPRVLEAGSSIVLALGEAVASNLPVLVEAGSNAVLTLATGLVEQFPVVAGAGLQAIVSLANGIADNLPELIPTIVDVVLQIVDTLTDPGTLSALVDASIAIIIALASGLIDALPRLLEKAPEIVANLVDAIIENAPKLLGAALELIVNLVTGVANHLPKVFEKGKEIVTTLANGILELLDRIREKGVELVMKAIAGITEKFREIKQKGAELVEQVKDGFKQKVEDAKNWGKDLISNFISGIKQKWEDLKSTVSQTAQSIKNYLGFSEPKEGPLSNFHTYAPDMMALFAKGIRDNEKLVTDQISKSFDFGTRTVDFAASGVGVSSAAAINAVSGAAGGSAVSGPVVINLMFPDGTQFARYLLPSLIDVARSNGTPIANPV